MKNSYYRNAVEWIATEDAPGDELGVEALAETLTVCLVADVFNETCETVAKDVFNWREKHKD